jgi:hypothetical protein
MDSLDVLETYMDQLGLDDRQKDFARHWNNLEIDVLKDGDITPEYIQILQLTYSRYIQHLNFVIRPPKGLTGMDFQEIHQEFLHRNCINDGDPFMPRASETLITFDKNRQKINPNVAALIPLLDMHVDTVNIHHNGGGFDTPMALGIATKGVEQVLNKLRAFNLETGEFTKGGTY